MMTNTEAIECLKRLHKVYESLEREQPLFTEQYLECEVALTNDLPKP